MTKNLKRAVGRIQDRKKDRDYLLPGLLGLRRGSTNVVSVPGRPSFVYVRLRNNTSEVIQAFNDKVSPVYDLPVLVVRDEIDPSKYRLESRDYGQYSNWTSWSPYLPAHGGAHSRSPSGGGGDPVWVYGSQYMPLLVSPSGTLGAGNVVIDGSTYYFDSHEEYRYAGGTGTSDILIYKPTGSDARMVLVYLDTDGNPALMPGDEFNSSLTGTVSILPYVPTINVDLGVPLAAVRLLSGTSSIVWENLYDVRPLITGERRSRIGIYDDGAYVSSGTAISFEANLDVVASGTIIYVAGQAGGGGGGSNTTYYDDGAFVATGTKVSFDDNLNVVSTGTSIFVSSTGGAADGDTPTYPYVSDDNVGVATGTQFEFGENLSVVATGTVVFIDATDTTDPNTDTPTYPAVFDDNVFVSTGTALVFNDNISVAVTGTTVYLSSTDTTDPNTDTPTYPYVSDDNVGVATGTQFEFGSNLSVVATGTVVFIDATDTDTNTDTPTYPAVFDDNVFVSTGTSLVFNENISVAVTGTTVYMSSTDTTDPNTDTPTYPAVSEDSVFVATGTHFDFGENMNVVATGTTVYISSVDTTDPNTDTPTYPAIWDGNKSQFIATGTSLVFQGNLDTAIASGTTVFLESNEFINSSSDAKIGDEGIELLTQSQGLPFTLDKSRAIQFVDSFGDSSDAAQIYRTKNATVPVYLEALYFEVNKTYDDTVSVGNMVTRISNTVFGGSGSSKYNAYTILEVDYDKNGEFGVYNADLIVYDNKDIISTNDILATGTVNGGLLRSTTDVEFDGELVSRKNGINHDVYGLSLTPMPLGTENSDDYWGGGYSTQAKTVWDMSADFTGTLPSDTSAIKAYQLTMAASDSGSTTTGGDTYVIFGVDNTAGNGVGFSAGAGRADGRFDRGQVLAPCDANGDLWVEIKSTGTGTVTVYVALIGYYI